MGRLIVLEGLDGSGKQTLTHRLREQARAQGATTVTLAFPRYGVDVHADLVRDALYGRLGDLSDSVYGPALLFALDRRAAAPEIRELLQNNDLVLLDRYVSSNAAYGAARLGGPAQPTDFPQWVLDLEIGRFDLPRPDRQLLLATPVELSAQRARSRAESDSGRALDAFEADGGLQSRTGEMYRLLAEQSFLSPWTVLTPDADPAAVVEQLLSG